MTKCILVVGTQTKIPVPQNDGSVNFMPMIKNVNFLFKDSNKALMIRWKFQCFLGTGCPSCSLSPEVKTDLRNKNQRIPICNVEHRAYIIKDSFLFFSTSLSDLIEDYLNLLKKEEILKSLEQDCFAELLPCVFTLQL